MNLIYMNDDSADCYAIYINSEMCNCVLISRIKFSMGLAEISTQKNAISATSLELPTI